MDYFELFSNAVIQATVVFIFLTYFFFSYVSPMEKTEFQAQIKTIVDDIYNQNSEEIKRQFPTDENSKLLAKIQVYGLIDSVEDYLVKNTKDVNSKIDEKNKSIVNNSILTVLVTISLVVLIFIVSNYFGYHMSITDILKESLFILIFVAITEYLFLTIITEKYISIDSGTVKETIAKSVIDYINNR
jgi:Fe2+ transport system protein B